MLTKLFALAYVGTSILTATPNVLFSQEASPVFEQANLRFERYFFEEADEPAYIIRDTKGKAVPEAEALNQIALDQYTEVTLTGQNGYDFWKVEVDGKEYFIDHDDLTTDPKEIDALLAQKKQEEEEARRREEAEALMRVAGLGLEGEAPESGADVMDLELERSMELRKDIRQFASDNPEIAAQMIKVWLKGGDGNA